MIPLAFVEVLVRLRNRYLGMIAASALALATSRSAHAGSMDPTPERLVLQPPGLPAGQTCQGITSDPEAALRAGLRPNDFACRANNLAFRNFASELGAAIAPTSFYPARSTGIGGLSLSLEMNVTTINAGGEVQNPDGSRTGYWRAATRGKQDPSTKRFGAQNDSPDSLIQVYSFKVRKGLPLGFELIGAFGYLGGTTLWVGGGDIRWSLLEGFRKGTFGYLPDVSVGSGVRTLAGSPRMYLTVASVDVKLSKPFTLADSSQLIPTLGYQRLFMFADTTIVDLTPNTDALNQCGYTGNNAQTGAPVCSNKLSNGTDNNSDYNNNTTFDRVRMHRHRGMFGLHYRYEYLSVGTQAAFDLTDPSSEDASLVGGRQWTFSFELGAHL